MITVTKGELKKNLNVYFDRLKETGEEIIVTEDDIPVIKILSLKKREEAFAEDINGTKHYGDILEEKKEQKEEEWEEF